MFQVLVIGLVVTLSLKADGFLKLEPIALLWSCYGLIALTLLFFAATLLLFIGIACNQVSDSHNEN
jgi:hypothetical protein